MKRLAPSDRVMDDAGMTLVELLIASTLLVILTTVVAITMGVVNQVSANVTGSYQEYDQVLPALAPFSSLVRAEVEPAPATATGISPSPGFASVGNFSLTFYANVGTVGGNVVTCPSASVPCAATTAGPAKIVAQELDAAGSPVTANTLCTTKIGQTCSFVVRRYLPITTNGISSCPGVGTGPQCVYSSNYAQVVTVSGVVNNPNATAGPFTPIFAYNAFNSATNTSANLTPTNLQLLAPTTQAMASQLDSIQSVSINLRVAKPTSDSKIAVENQLIIYRYPQSPGSGVYPFQYSTSVG